MLTEEMTASLAREMPELEELYRRLHAHPELSMQESVTAAAIEAELTSLGLPVGRIGGGLLAVIDNGPGPSVLFRADFDALPVKEETGLAYASTATQTDRHGVEQPVMHACGHDMHVAAALGAARILARHRDQWSGRYIALFQPGEETGEGARAMVAGGLVEAIGRPDVAFAQHVLSSPHAGVVATAPGPILSTAQSVRVTVYGAGSHGSMPHLGIDPVVLASAIVMRLQGIVAREISPSDFAVVTVGRLSAGSSPNIIPAQAILEINVRAYRDEVREQLLAAISRIVHAECEASGTRQAPLIETLNQFPLTRNDPAVERRVAQVFQDYFGPERVVAMEPATASEDFSIIADALGAPYLYWGLGGFAEGREAYPNHNPKFAPDIQPTLTTGIEAILLAALSYLK